MNITSVSSVQVWGWIVDDPNTRFIQELAYHGFMFGNEASAVEDGLTKDVVEYIANPSAPAASGIDLHDMFPDLSDRDTCLALIAGDQTATEPQPGEATGWTCGASTRLTDDPPTCTDTAPLHLVLTFADCWDGVHLDAEDHHAHVRYSTDGACPASHPVSIPQLTVSIKFPIWGAGHDLTLASGSIYSAHGDFLNGWGEAGLEREVAACIHRGAVCDLASNREEEALFSYGT
mgnify:CR=1 FL=1